jgi:hypothetical protein
MEKMINNLIPRPTFKEMKQAERRKDFWLGMLLIGVFIAIIILTGLQPIN